VQEVDPALTSAQTAELRWLCESLILTKPATASVLVHVRGRTVARYGVMGSSTAVTADAPIVAKALRESAASSSSSSKETYLQNLPGKVEFSYLPENCQTVLLLPLLGGEAVVVVGGSQARAYTPKDIAWIKGVCERTGASLLA
jgi:Cofactor assembly of complex C subunit B, CCB2/CCB4